MMRTRWWGHTAVVIAAVISFMAIAAASAWPWWEFAFLSDDSPVSWLSSALLLANAAVAFSLALSRVLPRGYGYCLTAALTTLSLDEQFLLHERIQEATPLGNLTTWLVAIGGAAFVMLLWRASKSASARMLLASALAIGIFAIGVDLLLPATAVGRIEEAYEVLAESLFLCGLLEISRDQLQSRTSA